MDSNIKKYKISIVMSCYNGAEYLEKQLESICKQDMLPDEMVIVDDCSSDNTLLIIDDFIANQKNIDIIFIKHEENQGYRKSFYEAIKMTTGDLIFCCDQDDIWLENKISKSVEILDSNSQIVVLNTNYYLIDSDGNPIKEVECFTRNRLYQKKQPCNISLTSLLKYNISMGCTMCLKSVIRNCVCEHWDALMCMELPHDWSINIIGAMYNGTYYAKERLMKYRIHSQNTIGLNRANNRKDRINDLDRAYFEHNEMMKILKDMKIDSTYVKDILKSYEMRIDFLKNKKRLSLLFNSLTLLKSFTIKSIVLDFFLMNKE